MWTRWQITELKYGIQIGIHTHTHTDRLIQGTHSHTPHPYKCAHTCLHTDSILASTITTSYAGPLAMYSHSKHCFLTWNSAGSRNTHPWSVHVGGGHTWSYDIGWREKFHSLQNRVASGHCLPSHQVTWLAQEGDSTLHYKAFMWPACECKWGGIT